MSAEAASPDAGSPEDPTRTVHTSVTGAGVSIGPYLLLLQIGEGGMGVVYHARQREPIRRDVALKVIKPGMDSRQVIARFESERQALAVMDHPSVARVLDAGTTAAGLPYFVMELVDGAPITRYCDTKSLTVKQRIELFIPVCQAIQHAHQKGIIHRDIKPSNILVAEHDRKPVPKVIDFGLAKALGAHVNQATVVTNLGTVVGTLDYMSPEQAELTRHDVDTRSDLYSLGAVLYELLTGTTPLERERLAKAGYVEALQRIREEQPLSPSARLRRSPSSAEIAAQRRSDPSRLPKLLRGELDWIVMKALEKERERRYETANGLARDLERYLAGEPVEAVPPSAMYRMGKFVRKHRAALSTAAAFVALLIAGVTVSTIEARIAQRRFAQVRELANTFLFQFYDQVTPLPGSLEVRKSIVDTARKYLDGLSQEAGNDKDLILELAQAYQRLGDVQGWSRETANLGQVDEARRSYQRALDLYTRLGVNSGSPAELRRKMAEALWACGNLELNASHYDAAEPIARRALDLLRDAPDDATRMLRTRSERFLGSIRRVQGYNGEALALYESSLGAFRDLQAKGYSDKNLGTEIDVTERVLLIARAATGDLDGALNARLERLRNAEPCDEHGPPGKACRALSQRLEGAATLYSEPERPNLNEPGKAARMLEQAVHIDERIAALDPNDWQARSNLANLLARLADAVWKEDPKRALTIWERGLSLAKSLPSKEQYVLFEDYYLDAVSRPLIKLGRLAEARKALTEELRRSANDPPTQYEDRLGDIPVHINWVSLLVAEGNRAEARKALEKTIRDADALRASHRSDLTPIYYLSETYRMLASMTSGQERREVLLKSAAAWHSWPATSYTKREEQKDLVEANR